MAEGFFKQNYCRACHTRFLLHGTSMGLGTNLGPGYPVERGRLDQVRSCITMLTRSRAFFIASILRTIRPVLFSKTGNTLESAVEVVKPPLEDMGDGKTKTATFAMS